MNLNELPGSEIILPGLSDLHRGESNYRPARKLVEMLIFQ